MISFFVVVAGTASLRAVTAMDWGSMDQYKNKLDPIPQPGGTTVWISGKEGDGFDIVLSQDAKAKVEGVLEGCGTTDDTCYRDVMATLETYDMELDSQIERRSLGSLLSKTAKGSWSMFSNIGTMLWFNWKMKADKFDNAAFHIPLGKAQEAADSASAPSIVHSAQGSFLLTITPSPVTPSLTGVATPAITTAPSDAHGHKQGDLLATLDADLARQINEASHRMLDCADGRNFDTKHGTRKRGGGATYGQALCAAEGVVGMARKGGPFADLTMLSHENVGIDFAATAVKAKEALLVLKDFILAYRAVLAIPEDLVDQLGTYILAIIIDSMVIENIDIGPENYIGPDLAITYGAMSPRPSLTSTSATPSSSSSGCPDPSARPIFCGDEGNVCNVKLPDRNAKVEQDPVCADGKWQGCKCFPPEIIWENIFGEEEYWSMQMALSLYKEMRERPPVRTAKVTCRNSKLSAPKHGDGHVEQAINTWCKDNDGKEISSDGLYWRWGVDRLGVPDRSSFWLRAAKTCDEPGKFKKDECEKALMDGMEECDKGGDETHGLAASIGCLDYSIDFSSTTDSHSPPWVDNTDGKKFPPPEDAPKQGGKGEGHAPTCDNGKGERPLTDEDLSKAIDAFCQNGQDIVGFGQYWRNMFDYPPSGTPQFYDTEHLKMHLTFGAETINNGGEEPYEDMNWCRDYDWKMGKDDCTYAFRKLYTTCSKDRAMNINGGEYTYRCVKYKSWPVNLV